MRLKHTFENEHKPYGRDKRPLTERVNLAATNNNVRRVIRYPKNDRS